LRWAVCCAGHGRAKEKIEEQIKSARFIKNSDQIARKGDERQ